MSYFGLCPYFECRGNRQQAKCYTKKRKEGRKDKKKKEEKKRKQILNTERKKVNTF